LPPEARRYATLSRRLQASCVDVVVAFHTPFAAIGLVTWLGGPLAGPLAVVLALTPLVLEPILVARTGSTVGHWLLGLRVVAVATGRPPGLVASFGRYVAKVACLGPWLSPLIAITRQHQGVHDMLCGTVVEVVDPSSRRGRLAAYDLALESRTASIAARVASTVGYSAVLAGGLVIVHLLRAMVCGDDVGCSGVAPWIAEVGLRLWFPMQYAVLWLGPAGRLPGARG
jgi:uncharacterized RDD family membrane protein YckC